jgi:hypothetical protein
MTPKELRADAQMLKMGEYDGVHIMHAWIALREYADLKEAAEKGVTDEVAVEALRVHGWTSQGPSESPDFKMAKEHMRKVLLAVAPLLALKGDKP